MEFEQLTHQNIDSFCARLAEFLGNGYFTLITLRGHVHENVYLKEPLFVEDLPNGCKAVSVATVGGVGQVFTSFYPFPNAAPIVSNDALNRTEFAFYGDQLHVRVSLLSGRQVDTFDVRLFKY